MSIEWIHVITATKVPQVRTGGSVFEFYDTGFDPNVDTPFGPDKETMFLPVTRLEPSVINPVLEQAVLIETEGDGGQMWPGHHVDPDWVVEYNVVPQDLDESKRLKVELLTSDRDSAISDGYTVGPFQFPFTEHFFRLLADRLRWLEDAIAALQVPSNTQLTFSDLSYKEVSVGYDSLKNHFVLFGKQYLGIYEKEVDARNRITAASTIEAVDLVAWNF